MVLVHHTGSIGTKRVMVSCYMLVKIYHKIYFQQKQKSIQGFYVLLNLRNDKWLINFFKNLHKNMIGNYFRELSENLYFIHLILIYLECRM